MSETSAHYDDEAKEKKVIEMNKQTKVYTHTDERTHTHRRAGTGA